MKKTEENGKQIGYIKGDCSITTVELYPDGSCERLSVVKFDTFPECDHDYSMLGGEEVPDLWPTQTRKEASQLGQNKYYTGRECKYKHVSQRYVSSGLCIACISARSRQFKLDRAAADKDCVPISIMVHKDDVATALAVLEGLNKARGLL